jgi:hypothetical protein
MVTTKDGVDILDQDWAPRVPGRSYQRTDALHGEDSRIVPIDASAHAALKLLHKGTPLSDPGHSRGMLAVNAEVLNADLVAFVRS